MNKFGSMLTGLAVRPIGPSPKLLQTNKEDTIVISVGDTRHLVFGELTKLPSGTFFFVREVVSL